MGLKSLQILAVFALLVLGGFVLMTSQPNPDKPRPDEMSIPYSNITEMYQSMMNGIVREENYSNVSHSLENRFQATIRPEMTLKLPKTLHFIWVGSLIREKYVNTVSLFALHNPNYEVILWTDQITLTNTSIKFGEGVKPRDAHEVIPLMRNFDIISKMKNVATVSDLMRYELIYMFGGVYLDTDSFSVAPIRETLSYSFVSPGEPNSLIQNAIFGFPKGSRFLEFVMSAARERYLSSEWPKFPVWMQFGPTFLTTAFVQYDDPRIRMIWKDYLTVKSDKSIIYQTNDGTWWGQEGFNISAGDKHHTY